MSDALGDYLNSISRVPLLTSEEELHLGRLVREWQDHEDAPAAVARRGKRALDRIVSANLRLVVSVVTRYRRRFAHLAIEPIDLVQAGNIGLIRAVEKFDPKRGYRFSTFAYWWIRQAVSRHIQEVHPTVRVPVALVNLMSKIEGLCESNGKPLAVDDLSRRLEESPRRIELALSIRQLNCLVSLDQSLGSADAGDLTLLDTVTDGHRPEADEDYAWLHGHLHQLSDLELNVLQQRYREGRGQSLMQLASQIGKTRYQVQVIEQRALKKLRAALTPALHPSPGFR
ncbi:MAG: sigma-70 family RNA polymerase sigma factor [Cyanobium sp. M30B3]|nr:MAG: sigma-70 family RNA polymerase sigma factor [Cyanobium sp. M30B3]